jgi:hypothetical protein
MGHERLAEGILPGYLKATFNSATVAGFWNFANLI